MSFFEKKDNVDELSAAMQQEVIRVASIRIGKSISKELSEKICQKKWSYMGLEMIIDNVRNMKSSEIEDYLAKLD